MAPIALKLQLCVVSSEKPLRKIFYTRWIEKYGQTEINLSLTVKFWPLQCKIIYTSILPSIELHFYFSAFTPRERERERVWSFFGAYTYFLVIILRENQTLETIFRLIFQKATKQLKFFSSFQKIFSPENILYSKNILHQAKHSIHNEENVLL